MAVGAGVGGPTVGDEVLGWTPGPSAQATHVAVPAARLVPGPPRMSWAVAGSLGPYGDGLRERPLQVAGADGIDAFIDLHGPEHLDLAVALGVPPERIQTTVAMERAAAIGAKADGRHNPTAREIQLELVELVASAAIELPIAATYPLDRVADAFAELERRHTRGKIVLIP